MSIDEPDPAVIDTDVLEVVWAWRIWFADPRDPTGLFAPTACRDFKVTRRIATAWCPNPAHQPPVVDCTCGIYGAENLVDALYRLRVTQYNLRTGTSSGVCYGRDLAGRVPVLSRVVMLGARVLDRMPDGRLFFAPELRAAAVCIEQLFVTGVGDACPHFLAGHRFTCRYCPDVERIAQSLTDVFGVRTVIGLPRYSNRDWETRSQWCKRLGPQGLPDPSDGEYASWFLDDEPAVAFTAPAPAPSETVGGETVCAEVLSAPAPAKPRTPCYAS